MFLDVKGISVFTTLGDCSVHLFLPACSSPYLPSLPFPCSLSHFPFLPFFRASSKIQGSVTFFESIRKPASLCRKHLSECISRGV